MGYWKTMKCLLTTTKRKIVRKTSSQYPVLEAAPSPIPQHLHQPSNAVNRAVLTIQSKHKKRWMGVKYNALFFHSHHPHPRTPPPPLPISRFFPVKYTGKNLTPRGITQQAERLCVPPATPPIPNTGHIRKQKE